MTASLTWQEIDVELGNLYSDLDRIQTSLYTKCMKVKNTMHSIKDLQKQVKHRIHEEEAQDDAKDYS